MKWSQQRGMTLIELMVALVLGLLIVAVAIQLFITGQSSINLQRTMAEIQDNANFGLNYIETDIRKANLDAQNAVVNDQTIGGGIVLTSLANQPTGANDQKMGPNLSQNTEVSLLSRGNGQDAGTGNAWTGMSNVASIQSDQLVIQYKANQNGFDCEGQSVTAGTYIIQRYFLRKDGDSDRELTLACDAGRYTAGGEITGLGGAGQIVIRRVDYFHVLLGVSTDMPSGPTNFRYMTVPAYMALTMGSYPSGEKKDLPIPRPRIQSIQIGMIVRGSNLVSGNAVPVTPTFTVLDQAVTLTGNERYLRQVMTQTIALRNGFGIRGTGEDGL